MNDLITIPLEINGRTISISCIVIEQDEKIIIGQQCLQAFGLLVGVNPKQSVHMRLGANRRRTNNRRNNNYKAEARQPPTRHWRQGRGGKRAPTNIGYGSRDLKALCYPGTSQAEEALEIEASPEDLMIFD